MTLVYSLSMSGEPRDDGTWHDRVAAVHAAARRLQLPDGGPVMIGCTRHVIGLDRPQPQSIELLRGVDRDVADALVSAGFSVTVRTCIAARRDDYDLDDELRATLRDLEVMRRNAAVAFLRAADHAPDGFIGNGADSSYLHKLAALEISRRQGRRG